MVTKSRTLILSDLLSIFRRVCLFSSGISDNHTKTESGSEMPSAEPYRISSNNAVIMMVLPEPVGAEKEITCGLRSFHMMCACAIFLCNSLKAIS